MIPHKHDPAEIQICSWPHLMSFELKVTNVLKSTGWGLDKSELPWEQIFYSSSLFCAELLAWKVSMVCVTK